MDINSPPPAGKDDINHMLFPVTDCSAYDRFYCETAFVATPHHYGNKHNNLQPIAYPLFIATRDYGLQTVGSMNSKSFMNIFTAQTTSR